MDAKQARKTLVRQHDQIRAMLGTCSVLAHQLLDGEPVQPELDLALTRLRLQFAEHNTTESAMISPLLRDSPHWGAVLIDRMLEEHVAEHAAFWALLAGTAAEVAAHMDELVDELDAHMAAEERTFLSPVVLREDVITRHRTS